MGISSAFAVSALLQLSAVVVQLTAAFFALRLIRVTGGWASWALIAGAFCAMAFRRSFSLWRLVSGDPLGVPNLVDEVVALSISAFMLAGVLSIAPLFRAIKRSAEFLQRAKDELEIKVAERTEELRDANTRLSVELDERRRAEIALEAERKKLFSVLDSLPAFVHLKGPDFMIRFANRRFREVFGNPENKPCYELLRGRSEPCDDCHSLEVLKTKAPQQIEWTNADNTRTYEAYHYPFCFGDELQVLTLGIDISERKRAETALRESEEKYRVLFEGSTHGILAVDVEKGRFAYANPSICRMLGYSEIELRQLGITDIHPKDSLDQVMVEFESQNRGEKRMSSSLPCLRKDGTVFYADIAGAISIIQGRRYAVGFFMDVSERRQAEENLRQTRNYLDNLINHANAPIIVWDPSFQITQFNGAFENLAGYSAQEVIGQQLDLLFPKDSCEESLSKIARTSGGEYWESVEIPILHKDGNIRIALWNSANIHAEDGATIVATIAQGQDITARNQAQQKLRESEENLRYLASQILTAQERERRRISLELHDSAAQELSALKIGLENLLADSPEKPVEELNPRISGLLQGLQKTLSSIRTLSYDLRPPDLEHFGLVQAIKTHCEEFTARTGIKVDFMAAGIEAGHLDYDASINFYRIIQEGLTNVWRHSQAMNVNIRMVASFPKIILRLEDDGQGFDVMELEASRHGDKHLGLLGMRERVALLKGKIKIESQLEKGTKISIEIPWQGEDLGTKEETPHC